MQDIADDSAHLWNRSSRTLAISYSLVSTMCTYAWHTFVMRRSANNVSRQQSTSCMDVF
jgi:hypothetical protein